ncbi:MAG: caspase family protein, partial [Muribaculaceae bacterium]|nr:caspase family protein [Muribaculaceae bacterium]
TMGLPEENIRVYRNAGLAQMHRAFADIRNIVSAYGGKANVIFYYAGHGMPDESTKNAFLLPVDGDAMVSETCMPLDKVYADLGSMGAGSVMVFLDACFSGSQRTDRPDGMLTSARAVVIKPKDAAPQGNMFAFTATSGQETALPYKEKNHGMFTYFLLKKLQESKGNVSLRDLTDYVTENVKRQSTVTNGKPQTPTVTASGAMASDWGKRKFIHE